jgi:hypothetical protein
MAVEASDENVEVQDSDTGEQIYSALPIPAAHSIPADTAAEQALACPRGVTILCVLAQPSGLSQSRRKDTRGLVPLSWRLGSGHSQCGK